MRISISDADIKDPIRLRQRIAETYDQLYDLINRVTAIERLGIPVGQTGPAGPSGSGLTAADRALLNALSTGSSDSPIPNVRPIVPTVGALPPSSTATPGELVYLSTDNLIYRFDGPTRTWIAISSGSSALLSATHTDTVPAAPVRGDLIVGDSTPLWARFAKGSANRILQMNAAGTDPVWRDLGVVSPAGATLVFGTDEELLTLSTVGTTTDTTMVLPSVALILAVTAGVNTNISGGGVTKYSVGDPTTAARFILDSTALTVGNGFTGVAQWQGSIATNATGPVQLGGVSVRVTTDAVPTQGKLRLTVFSLQFTPATS